MEYEKLTGSLNNREYDIAGKRFGHLIAVHPTTSFYCRSRIWLFQCDCGNQVYRDKHTVTRGHTTSCGCVGKQTAKSNCQENRTCCKEGTNLGNLINQKVKKNNTSGYNGVKLVRYKHGDRWIAYIMFKRKQYHIGTYYTLEEAVNARKEAEELLYAPTISRHFDDLSDHLKRDFFRQQIKNK